MVQEGGAHKLSVWERLGSGAAVAQMKEVSK